MPTGMSPVAMCSSEWQRPEATSFTWISPGCGSSTSRSTTSYLPGVCRMTAPRVCLRFSFERRPCSPAVHSSTCMPWEDLRSVDAAPRRRSVRFPAEYRSAPMTELFNAAASLTERRIAEGDADRVALRHPGGTHTYGQLTDEVRR